MIKYTGKGTFQSIELNMFGDGYTKSVAIDLAKPPFNLNFQGTRPSDLVVVNMSPGMTKTVTISANILTIDFEIPPPSIQIDPVMTALPEDSLMFKIYFIYSPPVVKHAHRKNS